MSERKSADYDLTVPREQAENAFREALNLFVGRRCRYSVVQVSTATGVPQRMIECCKSYPFSHPDHRSLDFGAVLSLSKFLGPDFVNEWLGLTNMISTDPRGIGHDDLAAASLDYAVTHAHARHPESEDGVEISPTEDRELTAKRARLVA